MTATSLPDALEGRRILVVDDSPTALTVASRILRLAGCAVETAHNTWISGLVQSFEPDLILMDVHLGGGFKGTVATRAIRLHMRDDAVKIVLYSDLEDEELTRLAATWGADGYCHKDSDPETLLAVVREHLSGSSNGPMARQENG